MTTNPAWQWDESVPVARDFSDRAVVAAYDERHRRFRDVAGENAAVLARLGLKPDQIVGDFGCGTGAFARAAAPLCQTVYAVDVSGAMLDFLAWKAREENIANIVCRRGGFLSYVHEGPPFDAIHSSLALHHLPDFWKQTALNRLAGLLKSGGKFHLMDVVFVPEYHAAKIDAWIDKMGAEQGPEMAESLRNHVRQEYSTFTWILEGLLVWAGFCITETQSIGGILADYYCTKA